MYYITVQRTIELHTLINIIIIGTGFFAIPIHYLTHGLDKINACMHINVGMSHPFTAYS